MEARLSAHWACPRSALGTGWAGGEDLSTGPSLTPTLSTPGGARRARGKFLASIRAGNPRSRHFAHSMRPVLRFRSSPGGLGVFRFDRRPATGLHGIAQALEREFIVAARECIGVAVRKGLQSRQALLDCFGDAANQPVRIRNLREPHRVKISR